MKKAKFRYVEMQTMGEEDIVLAEFPYGLHMDLAVAKDLVASRLMFTENQPHYFIVDMSNIVQMDSDAREYMRHPDGGLKNIRAGAFLASNPIAAMFANFYIKTAKDFPTRFFYSKEGALNWIRAYRTTQLEK